MPKPVVIVGALDTKGEEFRFVRDLVAGDDHLDPRLPAQFG